MRYITMLLGLALVALAGLWFFTPVLDATYSRHAPGIAHSNSRAAVPNAAAPGGATRGASPSTSQGAPSNRSGNRTDGSQIGTKALADNFMSMINLGTGILGAWFTYLSYRQNSRSRRDRD